MHLFDREIRVGEVAVCPLSRREIDRVFEEPIPMSSQVAGVPLQRYGVATVEKAAVETPFAARDKNTRFLTQRRNNMTKSRMLVVALGLAALSASTVALAQAEMSAKSQFPLAVEAVEEAGGGSVVGTVKSINSATRKVSIEFPNGKVVDTVVKPEIQNLANVNPGDKVVIEYVEVKLLAVEKVDPALKGTAASAEKFVAPESAGLPGTTYSFVLEGIGAVDSIDAAARTVTVDLGGGRSRTLTAAEGVDLSGIAVGDTVKGMYVEDISISVEGVNPMKPKM
jgi:hypothetical protein